MSYKNNSPVLSVVPSLGDTIDADLNGRIFVIGTNGCYVTGFEGSHELVFGLTSVSMPTTTAFVGQIIINSVRVLHTYGSENTFVGSGAGNFTLTGIDNVTLGNGALAALTSGSDNVAIGRLSANHLDAGVDNVAIGAGSLYNATGASSNIAIGRNALIGTTTNAAIANTAVGYSAMSGNVTGTNNCAYGYNALNSITTGTYNIGIGGNGAGGTYSSADSSNISLNNNGVSGESNTLRIGAGTGTSAQQLNQAFISGINGITVTGTAVLVSSTDQLGIAVSSARYKENIQDMDSYSSDILKLRPVLFNYTVGEDHSLQSGLIAEEVEEVMPSLVVLDKEGLPQTVKYHDLPVLLLSELQKAIKRIEVLEAQLKG